MRKFLATTALVLCLSVGIFDAVAQESNVSSKQEMSVEQYKQLSKIMLKGTPDDLRKMIEDGLNVNSVYQCHTPLSMAIKNVAFAFGASSATVSPDETIEKIKILIEAGADVNKQACDKIAVTPLTGAIQIPFNMQRFETVFNETLVDSIHADTGNGNCLGMLPKPCKQVTPDDLDTIKYVVGQAYKEAHKALIPYMMKTITLLVENGADINTKDSKGSTAIHSTVLDPKVTTLEPLKYLVAKGANVNAQNNDGNTPLFFASASGNNEAVQILIDAGANEKVFNNQGLQYNEVTGQTVHTFMGSDGIIQREAIE